MKGLIKRTLGILILLFIAGLTYTALFNSEPEKSPINKVELPKVETNIVSGKIEKNQPLSLALLKKGISQNLAYNVTTSLNKVLNLRKCLPGDNFVLASTPNDSLLYFEYYQKFTGKYLIQHQDGELKATYVPPQINKIVKALDGEIQTSLWDALIEKCQDPELIMKFSDIFAWEVDFLTEVQAGDKFKLLYEEYQTDSGLVKYGDILAAEYIKSGTTYQAVLFEDPTGHKEYYNPLGKSLKKSFLKSPLNFRRITSRFSKSRFHPVLKIYRPHLGVDYAASIGTPIVSAADGTVIFLGWKKGLGKCVEVRHSKGLLTSYGHLSGFASGLYSGKRVEQNQIIGYVGNTGLTTGPHLDYRVLQNGKYVNPLKVTFDPAPPLKKEYLSDFTKLKDNLFSGLEILLSPTYTSK